MQHWAIVKRTFKCLEIYVFSNLSWDVTIFSIEIDPYLSYILDIFPQGKKNATGISFVTPLVDWLMRLGFIRVKPVQMRNIQLKIPEWCKMEKSVPKTHWISHQEARLPFIGSLDSENEEKSIMRTTFKRKCSVETKHFNQNQNSFNGKRKNVW